MVHQFAPADQKGSVTLDAQATSDLNVLEPGAPHAAVEKTLHMLYHLLSAQHHFPSSLQGVGFYCGGAMPLRAAVGLLILHLQRIQLLPYEVVYADQNYTPQHTLVKGQIQPPP